MGKKQINRKEFFTKALAGAAGLSLIRKNLTFAVLIANFEQVDEHTSWFN